MTRTHALTATLLFAALGLGACGDSEPLATTPGGSSGSSGGSSSSSSSGGSSSGGPGVACAAHRAFAAPAIEREAVTHFGRRVTPLGKLAETGNFPTGGNLTPDGRHYWAVDSGREVNYVWIVELASSTVKQKLPLPGGGGHVVFAPDGKTAYVPGEPDGGRAFPEGTPERKAEAGDAIHVYAVDTASGLATEGEPISIPSSANPALAVGSSRSNNSLVAGGGSANSISEWPDDLAISPDGKTLLVALLNSDRAALIDTGSRAVTVLTVGAYPRGAAIERKGEFGYIANSNDGTLSKIDLASGTVSATLALGLSGEDQGDAESAVLALAADPSADRLYASVANRDLVMVLDTTTDQFSRRIDLRRHGGQAGIGSSPIGLDVSADGCTLYVANAYDNAVFAVALKDRPDSATKAFEVIGAIPTGDYPVDVASTPDGRRLIWLAGKGMGANKGTGSGAAGVAPARNKQFWQNGLVGVLDRPDDRYFAEMASVVADNLLADAQPTPAATVLHGAATGPFSYAKSAQIEYVFIVVKENRTYDNIFGSLKRGRGQPSYQLYEDNCGEANTEFESADRAHPGCGTTPNAHALVRRWPLLDQFMANSEQSQEGHIYSTGGWLTDYTQRSSHWNPSNRGRPYDIGLYPVTYPPKYFLFDQLQRAGISQRIYGEKSGGLNPEPASQGSYRTAAQQLELQGYVNQQYPFNGLAACLYANEQLDPALLDFTGCIYDSSPRTQSRLTGANVPPEAVLSRMRFFELDFTPLVALNQWPKFAYVLLFNDHGSGNTPNNLTEAAEAADNDLGLGQLVDILSHSSIWPKTAIFVMEDDSQDGADHLDSHRMPAFVISPWAHQDGRVISRRYDQLSMLRTIQMILGLPPPSLPHALAVPMYDAFIAPTEAPNLAPYTAILPERSLVEQNGKTAASIAFRKNAPELWALGQTLPKAMTDWVPQSIADRIHYASLWGDDRHYPGAGPNASPLEQRRAEQLWAEFRKKGRISKPADADQDD
ncbi:MAG: bifunctional YncE family protein/alkaline phosphatase family protein [Stagnimonas sp.]|nr:bifunctional YncE family protein/alkaline phosphatase family protein [Stagnimonas sp.]